MGLVLKVALVKPGRPQNEHPTEAELMQISPTSSVLHTCGGPSTLTTTKVAPGRTWPQSCKVRLVRLFSWSTRTTPWLRPDIERTPRPVALTPSRPGRLMETVSPSGEHAQGHIASGRSPFAYKNKNPNDEWLEKVHRDYWLASHLHCQLDSAKHMNLAKNANSKKLCSKSWSFFVITLLKNMKILNSKFLDH